MSVIDVKPVALYELLARHWDLGAAVEGLAFDRSGGALAFALADGRVAVAPVADAESPQARYRVAADTGRATLSPRRQPVPAIPQRVLDGAPLHIASLGESGFIAGGATGEVFRLMKGCLCDPLAQGPGPIEAMAPTANGGVVVASQGLLTAYEGMRGRAMSRYEGEVAALAVAPDGSHLAIADARGLAVRAWADEPAPAATLDVGTASALCWSPDGHWLAVGLREGGLALFHLESRKMLRIPNYPGPVGALGWSADPRCLVTSGAYRIIVWSIAGIHGGGERPENVETGRAGFVPVTAVGMHPRELRVAAGYADGQVVVAGIGSRDELVVKSPGQGAVRHLRWSHDGGHLGFGTDEGHAAIVTFPPHLFK